MLADHVEVVSLGERRIVWNRLTGRHVAIDATDLARLDAADAGGLRDRFRRLHLVSAPELSGLIPCRSRLALIRPDQPALWFPSPMVRTAGGHGWVCRMLEPEELAIWYAIDDRHPVDAVARRISVPLTRVLAFLAELTAIDVQAVQLRDEPPSPRDPSLWRVATVARPASERSGDQRGADGETTLGAYHLEIDDPATHFDDRETTVAHAHGLPHPALGGRRFGEALFDALSRDSWYVEPALTLEVGCGDGEFAAAFVSRAGEMRYVRADLSPELSALQAERAPSTSGVLADAVALPFRDGSIGHVLSNEVIADLSSVPVDPEATGGPAVADVRARLRRYGIAEPVGPRMYNLGAWRFVEEIARVLAPGGRAYVSEFGEVDAAPEEAVQLDHPEVGIHFGELAAVARGCGLEARLVRLDDLLGVIPTERQLWREHHHGLRAMARAAGVHLAARAWTEDQLRSALPWPVEGLAWVPLTEPGAGPLITRFWALLLRKPR